MPMFKLREMSGAGWNEALQRIDAKDEFWERLQNDQVSNVVLDVCRRSTSTTVDVQICTSLDYVNARCSRPILTTGYCFEQIHL